MKNSFNQNLNRLISAAGISLTMLALLSGCSWSVGGGGGKSAQTTRGQELIDLKRALDQGAITSQEYENQKRLILSR